MSSFHDETAKGIEACRITQGATSNRSNNLAADPIDHWTEGGRSPDNSRDVIFSKIMDRYYYHCVCLYHMMKM